MLRLLLRLEGIDVNVQDRVRVRGGGGRTHARPRPEACPWVQHGLTPFMLAAKANHVHVVETLLDRPDVELDTILEVSECQNRFRGTNPRQPAVPQFGANVVHLCARAGAVEALRLLHGHPLIDFGRLDYVSVRRALTTTL